MTDLIVGLVLYRPSASGIATYSVEIAKALCQRVRKVYLCVIGMDINTTRELNDLGVTLIETGLSDKIQSDLLGGPVLRYMIISRKIRKLLHETGLIKKFDILHFTLPPAASTFRERYLTNAWVPLAIREEPNKNWKAFKFPINISANFIALQYHFLTGLVFEKASRIVAPTNWIHQRLLDRYAKVSYAPPPIGFMARSTDRNGRTPILLFTARDVELARKNVKSLLNAIRVLASHQLKFKVLLVGAYSAGFHEFIQRFSSETGVKIQLTGRVPRSKMSEIYNASDMFVLPSLYEELGYSVLEAEAHGLPIVASDIPTFKDFVINDVNGFLIRPLNDLALASKLELLIADGKLRSRMGQMSSQLVKERFSPSVVADKLVGIYEETLNP